ncbi:MAG TPA: SUMF1/EgtB/PvdO family nonheme iron enzyme [Mycoplana sp.]|nr:SUMF1/EgtB/PvdO family nonheme iron enzyme [Mycoplana sp.]
MHRARSASISSAAVLAALFANGAAVAGEAAVPGNPLVAVPGGPFVFGRNDGNDNERPEQRVEIQAFRMNRTEITNHQYRAFVAVTGHRPAFYADHPLLGLDDRPVVGVSWSDAEAFCAHYGLALPSERQFERAARGAEGKPYPWGGAAPDFTRANGGSSSCCSGDGRDGYLMTAPVGAFANGESAEGIVDLIGNVWEWTDDWYAPYEGEPDAEIAGRFRVLRGGGWNSDPARLSATYRLAYDPDFRFAANGGFRCVAPSN